VSTLATHWLPFSFDRTVSIPTITKTTTTTTAPPLPSPLETHPCRHLYSFRLHPCQPQLTHIITAYEYNNQQAKRTSTIVAEMHSDNLEQSHRTTAMNALCAAQKLLALLRQNKPHQKRERCIPPKNNTSDYSVQNIRQFYHDSIRGIQNGILRA
jgi:hypothetical protein